jgi:hypothetical protein
MLVVSMCGQSVAASVLASSDQLAATPSRPIAKAATPERGCSRQVFKYSAMPSINIGIATTK